MSSQSEHYVGFCNVDAEWAVQADARLLVVHEPHLSRWLWHLHAATHLYACLVRQRCPGTLTPSFDAGIILGQCTAACGNHVPFWQC